MRWRGRPRLPRSRRSPKSTSVFCISHASLFSVLPDTFPVCGYHAHSHPPSRAAPLTSRDRRCFLKVSYGGSVALRLSSLRRSRICADATDSVFWCPFVLYRTHCPPHIERES